MNKPKLLLADDSVTVRKVVELTFAGEGIDVSAATNSETAMSKFVEIQPNIVLVDVGLDGTNGYQICEMIKQDTSTSHIPVILLVGSFEPFDQSEAERVGADGFLTKPFQSIREMVAQVWDLLGRNTNQSVETIDSLYESYSETETLENAEAQEPGSAESIDYFPQTPLETNDIDDLYNNSFAQTLEIDKFDTVGDILGEAGMDDQMIEASYPVKSIADNRDESNDSETQAPAVKEFDWSSESIVSDKSHSALPETRFVIVEPADVETPVEDETQEHNSLGFETIPIISNFEMSPVQNQPETTFEPETISVAETTYEPNASSESDSPIENLSEFESEPGAESDSGSEFEPDPVTKSETFEISDPEPIVDVETDTAAAAAEQIDVGSPNLDNGLVREPSAELISLIAARVVEKLSEGVIREIAIDAVPRIAEKLIREALEEEKKS